jgi:hypothetical protein
MRLRVKSYIFVVGAKLENLHSTLPIVYYIIIVIGQIKD